MSERGDEVVPADESGGATGRPADERVRLARELVEAHRLLDPPVPVAQTAANVTVGAADELGRLILSFLLITIGLLAVAIWVTPWGWAAVAVWLVVAIWTIVRLSRGPRQARSAQRLIRR